LHSDCEFQQSCQEKKSTSRISRNYNRDDVKYLAAHLNKLTNNILLTQIRPLANKLINNTEKIDKIKILIEEQKHD